MIGGSYVARDTKRRRSTRSEVERFRTDLYGVVENAQPCSVRHAYYLAVTHGLVEKDQGGKKRSYTRVMRAIGDLREKGLMPFQWIVDDTRLRRGVPQWRRAEEALDHWTRAYRRDLWQSQPNALEVWCESDSLAGILIEVTADLGVTLLSTKGQSSKAFAWTAAQYWDGEDRDVVVLYVGDFDPAGLVIGETLEEKLRRYSEFDAAKLQFVRVAVLPDQVRSMGLLGHDLNRSAPGLEGFLRTCDEHGLAHEAVEAEAIDPNTMRDLLRTAIEGYVDPRSWNAEMDIERLERESLAAVHGRFRP